MLEIPGNVHRTRCALRVNTIMIDGGLVFAVRFPPVCVLNETETEKPINEQEKPYEQDLQFQCWTGHIAPGRA